MTTAKHTQLITGYYRLTDIAWEWHQALPNPDDGSALKALIAWETLVHPDHPLRKPGQDGLELFRGVFENGEARLLFSSAQVEYIRYYLNAMQLTAKPIPLPSSHYMIKKSDLKSAAPEYYDNAASLKKSIKTIDKLNKRLRALGGGSVPSRRLIFEQVRSHWASKAGTWLAIDFEWWDGDSSLLLEYGSSLVQWDADGNEINEQSHLIVKERMKYQNTVYTQGRRDYYNFGESEQVGKTALKQRVRHVIDTAVAKGPLFLVFHDCSQDIPILVSEQVAGPLNGLSYILPEETPSTGIYVVDTTDLFGALEGSSKGNKRSLQQTCRQLQVSPIENLHNAGNDAHYTMLALRAMAEGGPLDAQRQKRWPAFISANGLGVDLPGVDGNADIDDLEGPNIHNLVLDGEDVEMEE
ncbi:hypothetical protein BC835DRAFT_1320229 [Cytidiella melzeri]|nr:hypothetical protein BC835DRAFT_1320229 [Cytidiella melzeri]